MTELSNLVDSENRPLFSATDLKPVELVSIATLVCGTVLALLAFVCRWTVDAHGQEFQLLLIAASATSALMILSRIRASKFVEQVFLFLFAGTSILALSVWSAGLAFAVLLATPVITTLFLPGLLKHAGYELRLNRLASSSTPGRTERLTEADSAIPSGTLNLPVESESQSTDHSGESETDESDPWLAIQARFVQDETLLQNVTQWRQVDGTCCVVALVRCRFSQSDETCVVQLPFWPVLGRTPEVFCRVTNGPEATIRTTHELPHGLRLEVQLNERTADGPAPDDVIIEVVSTALSTAQAA